MGELTPSANDTTVADPNGTKGRLCTQAVAHAMKAQNNPSGALGAFLLENYYDVKSAKYRVGFAGTEVSMNVDENCKIDVESKPKPRVKGRNSKRLELNAEVCVKPKGGGKDGKAPSVTGYVQGLFLHGTLNRTSGDVCVGAGTDDALPDYGTVE
jgi:hypothetical protein